MFLFLFVIQKVDFFPFRIDNTTVFNEYKSRIVKFNNPDGVVLINIYHKNVTPAVSLLVCIWRNGPTFWRIE